MVFDAQTLTLLATSEEVKIETTRFDGTLRTTTIWVVVEGGDVFVRSVRGERGHWYQAALDRPSEVALMFNGGRRLPVHARPASDDASISRCSDGLAAKYHGDPALTSMLRPTVLATTVRLVPR